jgi:hypothetical protein
VNPSSSRQDAPSGYRVGRARRPSALPRERFSPLAHRDISRRRSNSVAFGAKRTFSEPRLDCRRHSRCMVVLGLDTHARRRRLKINVLQACARIAVRRPPGSSIQWTRPMRGETGPPEAAPGVGSHQPEPDLTRSVRRNDQPEAGDGPVGALSGVRAVRRRAGLPTVHPFADSWIGSPCKRRSAIPPEHRPQLAACCRIEPPNAACRLKARQAIREIFVHVSDL